MNFLQLINSVGGVLGIISLVTAAVFVALNRRKDAEKDADASTINSYRDNAESLNELLQTRNTEIDELKTKHEASLDEFKVKNEASLERIRLAESKADVLEKITTQAPSINKLIMQIGTQHQEMMKSMSTMTGELGNIAKAMKGK